MDRFGIERALVSTGRFALPDRLIACPVFQPGLTDLRAARIFPKRDGIPMSSLAALESRGVPIFVDLDQIDLDSPLPRSPVILTRASYREAHRFLPLMARLSNLHLEISYFFTYGGIEQVVRELGPERLVFGTTLPERDPGAAIGMLRYARISDRARQMIGFENLARWVG